VNPDGSLREQTISEALEAAVQASPARFVNEPMLEAAIHKAIGHMYMGVDQCAPALQHLEIALRLSRQTLGPEDPNTLGILENIAHVYERTGRDADAERSYAEALAGRRRTGGDNDGATIQAARALACFYFTRGRPDDATKLARELLRSPAALANDWFPYNLMKMVNAIPTLPGSDSPSPDGLRRVVDVATIVFGDEHPSTLKYKKQLAEAMQHAATAPTTRR
jgi:tetratricopeptide (TPR) repeat protein